MSNPEDATGESTDSSEFLESVETKPSTSGNITLDPKIHFIGDHGSIILKETGMMLGVLFGLTLKELARFRKDFNNRD